MRTNKKPTRSKAGGLSPWFLLAELKVNSASPPGPLEHMLLHPSLFPRTPYATMCANHAYREERGWDFKIIVTTASNTGFRGAVVFLPDPTQQTPQPTPDIIWSAIMNRTGAWMSSTGTGESQIHIKVDGATRRLSNAKPVGADNWTGFATGSLVIYLTDPPIGLAETTTGNGVRITILARPHLQLFSPIAGFMDWVTSHDQPGPGPTPTEVRFRISIGSVDTSMQPYLNSHTASAWLAGGYYLDVTNLWNRTTAPYINAGELWVFAIYTCNPRAVDWRDNDSKVKEPGFFVTWEEPGSGVVQLVGFEDIQNARLQADGQTGSIPHGAECCIAYHSEDIPKWNQRWDGITGSVDWELVYKGPNAYRLGDPKTGTIPDVPWPGRPLRLAPRLPPAAPTRLSPTELGQRTGTPRDSASQAATSDGGLRTEIDNLRSVVADMWTTLMTSGQPQIPCCNRLPPGHQTTERLISLIGSSVDNEPYPTSSPNNLGCQYSAIPTPLPQTPASTASLTDLTAYSNCFGGPTPSMLPHTGQERSPSTLASHECPGCDDPSCDDCFEDELVEVQVDAGQLATALSLLDLRSPAPL